MTDFYNKINAYFNDLSYHEEYGFDIWFTFVMCLITFIVAFNVYLQNKIKSNKTLFKNNKCNPFFMPFADILEESDDPHHNIKNMEACMNELNFDVGNPFLNTFKLIINSLTGMFTGFVDLFRRFIFFLLHILKLLYEIFKRITSRLTHIINGIYDIVNDVLHALSAIGGFITTIFYTFVLFFKLILQSAWILVLSWTIGAVFPSVAMVSIFAILIPILYIIAFFFFPAMFLLHLAIGGFYISVLILIFFLIIFFILRAFAHAIEEPPKNS